LAAPASKPVAVAAAPAVHVVNPGDTLLSVARRNHVPLSELARANSLEPTAKLRLGMKLTVPGAKTAAVAPAAQPATVAVAAQPAAAATAPATRMAAAGGPPQSARLAQATPTVEDAAVVTPVKAARPRCAADVPLAGTRQGNYELRRQDQWQSNDGIIWLCPKVRQ